VPYCGIIILSFCGRYAVLSVSTYFKAHASECGDPGVMPGDKSENYQGLKVWSNKAIWLAVKNNVQVGTQHRILLILG